RLSSPLPALRLVPAVVAGRKVRRRNSADPQCAMHAAFDIGDAHDAERSAIAVAIMAVLIIVAGIAPIAVEALLGGPGAHLDGSALAHLVITIIALRILAVAGHGIDEGADHATVVAIGGGVRLGRCGRRDRGDRRQSGQAGGKLRKVGHRASPNTGPEKYSGLKLSM